jgi:predicted NAD/FAD-binding protein
MGDNSLNIAIVGAGAAGLTAAYLLKRRHQVTLFEKAPQAGGYLSTWTLTGGPDKGLPFDMGFTVFKDRDNPTLMRLLERLEVPLLPAEWSFGFWDEKSRFQYALTGWQGLLSQLNHLSPAFLFLLRERASFNGRLHKDHLAGRLEGRSLGDYLKSRNYSPHFIQNYLLPLGAAIWSVSVKELLEFPANFLAIFLPSYLPNQRTHWKRIEGGSQTLVKALLNNLSFRVRTGEVVEEIKRKTASPSMEGAAPDRGQVVLRTREGKEETFDKVVLACHADEALALLVEPDEEEFQLLSPWRYQKNHALLHTDADILPPAERVWAGFNYCRERETTKAEPVAITCHLNRVLGLDRREQYFLTLNRIRPIPEKHILKEAYFAHPVFTLEALQTQPRLAEMNGKRHTYFCGSYFGHGFLEDAIRSALEVGRCFGIEL